VYVTPSVPPRPLHPGVEPDVLCLRLSVSPRSHDWRIVPGHFRDNSHPLGNDFLSGGDDSSFRSADEFRKPNREERGNCVEEFKGWIPAHLSLSNMANIIPKVISKFLLGQLVDSAQFRKLGSNGLCQSLTLPLLVCTDSFGHMSCSFA
jgi:hypothetical protein